MWRKNSKTSWHHEETEFGWLTFEPNNRLFGYFASFSGIYDNWIHGFRLLSVTKSSILSRYEKLYTGEPFGISVYTCRSSEKTPHNLMYSKPTASCNWVSICCTSLISISLARPTVIIFFQVFIRCIVLPETEKSIMRSAVGVVTLDDMSFIKYFLSPAI